MKVRKIYDRTYRICDPLGVYMFLIEGSEKALLIDTGYGVWDLEGTLNKITDKELIVCNTHGHLDHNGGNGLFEKVFQDPADAECNAFHSDPENRRNFVIRFFGVTGKWIVKLPLLRGIVSRLVHIMPMTLEPMPEVFDLGDRQIEVIRTPGHTPGSVCLLDRRSGVLFTGDTVCDRGVLLMCDHSLSVRTFRQSVEKLIALREQGVIDTLIPSHHRPALTPDFLYDYRQLCDDILSGEKTGRLTATEAGRGYRVPYKTISITYKTIGEQD
jgi:glyoxylase-like metal-dependent hydrolase (beta-lactamase superfamily II)